MAALLACAPLASAQGPPPVVIAGGDEEATDQTRGDGGPAVDGVTVTDSAPATPTSAKKRIRFSAR